MTTELIVKDFTPEQLKLITDTVAKGASKDELALFLYRCRNMGLDPLKPGQIYFIKYGNGPGTIVVGIEGFRARAGSTGKLNGVKRGALKNSAGELIGAFCEIYRSDWKECAREEVPLKEYDTGRGNWAKMPETMIKKVAEAAALRMAFPDVLGGVYTQEEMDQASSPSVRPEQPPTDGSDGNPEPLEYRIGFGQWRGKSLEQVYREFGPEKMALYVSYLEVNSEKTGKPISAPAQEFIKEAELFLGALENAPLDPNSDLVL